MRRIFIPILFCFGLSTAQVGINTSDPKAMFHIQGKTGSSSAPILNDVVFTNTKRIGIGTVAPTHKIHIVGNNNVYPIKIENINKTSAITTDYLAVDDQGLVGKYTAVFTTPKYFITENKFSSNYNVIVDKTNSDTTYSGYLNFPIFNATNNPTNIDNTIDKGSIIKLNQSTFSYGIETASYTDDIGSGSTTMQYLTIPEDGTYVMTVISNLHCRFTTNITGSSVRTNNNSTWGFDMKIYKKSNGSTTYELEENVVANAYANLSTNSPNRQLIVMSLKQGERVSVRLYPRDFNMTPNLLDSPSVTPSATVTGNCNFSTLQGSPTYFNQLSIYKIGELKR